MGGVFGRAARLAVAGIAACVLLAAPAQADGGSYATPGCNAGYCGNDGYLLYEYTKTAIEGTATISGSSATGDGDWPLRPGLYEIRLLLDDGYKSVAKSLRFRIVPR